MDLKKMDLTLFITVIGILHHNGKNINKTSQSDCIKFKVKVETY